MARNSPKVVAQIDMPQFISLHQHHANKHQVLC